MVKGKHLKQTRILLILINGVNLTISCYLDAFIFSILFQHVLKYESGII